MLTPPSDFGRCPCGGAYERRTVEVRLTALQEPIVLSDVPQGACPNCGSRVYKAGVLRMIERQMRTGTPGAS
jgi:hypothetical protein